MNELLQYQTDGAVFHVKITDGTKFDAVITLGETSSIQLAGMDELPEVRFLFNAEGSTIEYGGTSIPLPESRIKAKTWISLFQLSDAVLWKIKKDTFAGIENYVCFCDDVTVYIDAATRLPLKITKGNISIDVLSCEK